MSIHTHTHGMSIHRERGKSKIEMIHGNRHTKPFLPCKLQAELKIKVLCNFF